MTIRAFIAAELNDELKREIAGVQEWIRASIEPARVAWVRPASMHLTLKFLGDVDESIVPALHEGIETAIRDRAPIEIPLSRLGAFPRLKEPRNLWLGPDEQWAQGSDGRRLQALVRAIDDSCAVHGIPAEARPFSPHLTLGRVKAGEKQVGRALANHAVTQTFDLAPLEMSRVTLMKSQLDSTGAIHTPLWTIRLAR